MTKYKKIKNKKRFNKTLIFAVIVLVIAGGIVGGMVLTKKGPFAIKNEPVVTDDDTDINYSPPTEEELEQTQDHKNKLGEETDSDNPTDEDGKTIVDPFITVAQQLKDSQYGNRVEVRAYINIVESGGSCDVLLTKDSHKITRNVDTLPDASTTNCDVIMIPREEFPATGTWTVTVTYTSATAKGTSQKAQVEVK